MTPAEILADEIDKNPAILVDYADENELNEAYQAMYWAWREPMGSENWDKAQDFFSRHLGNAIERHKNMNGERAAEEAKEYHDELMREAA